MKIWLDLDGTIADLYSVDGWLADLEAYKVRPYAEAVPMLNMSLLARLLNKLQRSGHMVGIISWTSRTGTVEYNAEVSVAKHQWLSRHLGSVRWNAIYVVPYGTNKKEVCGEGILFDDEERNRVQWGEGAYSNTEIIDVLKELLKNERN